MSKRNGDAKLEEIKTKLEKNEDINILDLIFLPLMNSKQEMLS